MRRLRRRDRCTELGMATLRVGGGAADESVREMEKRRKKGHAVSPVMIEGRTIVKTFWGKAWCDNLERYSDFENRLPRGRTYVRNGSVIDLQISSGEIKRWSAVRRFMKWR